MKEAVAIFGLATDSTQTKSREILSHLRRRIVSGEFPPGSQLPTHGELCRKFKVGASTVHVAMNRLIRDGFLRAKRATGTFVVDHPPHLSRYALVIPNQESDPALWGQYYRALNNEVVGTRRKDHRRVQVFGGVEPHPDNETYGQLLHEIRSQRLAGLIFPISPWTFLNSPLLDEDKTLPRVISGAISIENDPDYPGMLPVVFDNRGFIVRSLDHLQKLGRKRVAFVGFNLPDDRWEAELAVRGMQTRVYWCHAPKVSEIGAARNVVQLLLRLPEDDRPDSLIILDDNLVEGATAGLLSAGVRVGHDLDVIGHCNFPWPTRAMTNIVRLGTDVREILAASIESIDQFRRGETVSPRLIPSRFDFELAGVRQANVSSHFLEEEYA